MLILLLNVTMKLPFVSSRRNRERQDREENRPRTIQISVPSELMLDLLDRGAILQIQMGPVPLRPDLARPGPRPERPESRPETSHTKPNVTDENPRPNPAGRSGTDPPRPKRPQSRCQAIRPVSPFTDWFSLSHNEVISVDSKEDDYVPRSPEYIPDSPGPVETEDQNPNNNESGLSRRTGFSLTMRRDPDLLWAEETCRGFPPF